MSMKKLMLAAGAMVCVAAPVEAFAQAKPTKAQQMQTQAQADKVIAAAKAAKTGEEEEEE